MLCAFLLAAPKPLNILFVGNSLLNGNAIPEMVGRMLETDGRGRRATTKAHFFGHLEDIPNGSSHAKEIVSGKYDVVVLQGAMVSMSHKRNYAQDRGIALAKGAKKAGSKVLLYVEWPRKGFDESDYTLNVYRGISSAAKVEIVPICYAWDRFRKDNPRQEVWMEDGNHANMLGSYLAAAAVYHRLAGTQAVPSHLPKGIDRRTAERALSAARETERNWLRRKS